MEPLTPEELRTLGFTAMQTFVREKNDLGSYVLAGRTLMEAALGLASHNPEHASAYTFVALSTSYNIAAACWPGWEDAQPNISPEHRALGLELSRFNVETAESLNAPPERRKNGYWILGVHLLANEDYEAAKSAFMSSSEFSDQAGLKDASLMAKGWVLVCDILSGDDGAKEALETVKSELKSMGEDGEFYADQYDPAIAALQK